MTETFQNQFAKDASLFPHMLDVLSDQVLISQMSEEAYRQANFLDQRIITPELQRQPMPWNAVEAAPLPKRPSPSYIFHIGHVGSTLISRLLGELPGTLALREPHILRSFAEIAPIKNEPQSPWSPGTYRSRLRTAVNWLSRTYQPDQHVIIKASSFVSEIADELIGEADKALYLYVPFERYLETILAGEGSQQEALQLAGARLIRTHKRLGVPVANLWALSLGQKIALGWLCEMLTLIQTAKTVAAGKIYWLNFDDFLDTPQETLSRVAAHFGLEADPDKIESLIAGPIMSSYSKAPEHDYSPDLRKQLLVQARANYAKEISETTQWVYALGESHPAIKTALAFEGQF